ncbi:MAG: hypothetical protein A2289_14600 [Deltaproteobacteria bacterium RIFOXYA12_FULL_58_15]|nr:MAG: hypothetical protein A2289_14600 [Deltaproteobacteria bacterium RIFOXYA12_FULL_58_15]OGR13343.1 MAG: hypothetical protein A2341_15945 [Deltaproteobacteria bacterium RIFOXYB12_FULL_58_9]
MRIVVSLRVSSSLSFFAREMGHLPYGLADRFGTTVLSGYISALKGDPFECPDTPMWLRIPCRAAQIRHDGECSNIRSRSMRVVAPRAAMLE